MTQQATAKVKDRNQGLLLVLKPPSVKKPEYLHTAMQVTHQAHQAHQAQGSVTQQIKSEKLPYVLQHAG